MIREAALEAPRGEIIGRGRKPTLPGTSVLLSAEQTAASPSPSPQPVFPKGMTVSRKHRWQGRADNETADFEGLLCPDRGSSGVPPSGRAGAPALLS